MRGFRDWRVLVVRGEGGGPCGWGEDSHQVKCVTSGRHTILHCGVLSSEEPFMASSGRGGMDIKVGAWREPLLYILVLALCSDWKTAMVE